MPVKKKAANTKPAKAAKAAPARSHKSVVKALPAIVAAPVVAPVVDMAVVAAVAPPAEAVAAAKKSKSARYQLPNNMEIPSLAPVHADLVAMEASNEGPFVLDGANLNVIDTAGLQLLISFVSAVKSSGKKVSWDNYSVQAYQLANELGVVDQLGD